MQRRIGWTQADIDGYEIEHDIAFVVGVDSKRLIVVTLGLKVSYRVTSKGFVKLETTNFEDAVKMYNEC